MLPALNNWHLDSNQILSQNEIDRVLVSLRSKMNTSKTAFGNLILFRLLNTIGLRISEALNVPMSCVRLDCEVPHIVVPNEIAKMGTGGTVPIWSAQTIDEFKAFKQMRVDMGANGNDCFFCSLAKGESYGQPIARQVAGRRYKTIIRTALSEERAKELHPHSSRHTFISACLARGVSLAETQRSARHRNLATTSVYSHLFRDRNFKIHNLD